MSASVPVLKPLAPLADLVSFTSIQRPTKQEQKLVAEIQKLQGKKLLSAIKEKVKDASALVRLKAYEAILAVAPLKYTAKEKQLLAKAEVMATELIKKYDNGKNIDGYINDLKKEGFKFYFADDILPEDLWTDEEFLESWKMDEDAIDEQLENPVPLAVNKVLKKKDSAEIHYRRKDCKAMVLFNQRKPSPETFWHEMFHYCQKKAGLFGRNVNPSENDGSAFAKRELETYQFIINNRNVFKTPVNTLKLDIAIWNSYRDLYNFEKEGSKKRAKGPQIAAYTFDAINMLKVNGGKGLVPIISDVDDPDSDSICDRERSMLNRLAERYNMSFDNVA